MQYLEALVNRKTWSAYRKHRSRYLEEKHRIEEEIYQVITVNSEIFARDFIVLKFRENKIVAKWRNHSVVY